MVTGTTGEIGIADGGRGHGSDKMELGRGLLMFPSEGSRTIV